MGEQEPPKPPGTDGSGTPRPCPRAPTGPPTISAPRGQDAITARGFLPDHDLTVRVIDAENIANYLQDASKTSGDLQAMLPTTLPPTAAPTLKRSLDCRGATTKLSPARDLSAVQGVVSLRIPVAHYSCPTSCEREEFSSARRFLPWATARVSTPQVQ